MILKLELKINTDTTEYNPVHPLSAIEMLESVPIIDAVLNAGFDVMSWKVERIDNS